MVIGNMNKDIEEKHSEVLQHPIDMRASCCKLILI